MKITQILKETRAWAEQTANRFAYPQNLCGLCAIVSKELFTRLKKHGYNCNLVCNDEHCFVTYKNRILDLTASQFNRQNICIYRISKKLLNHCSYWNIEETFDDVNKLSRYQKYNNWHKSQIELPVKEKINV